jgi:hypothetical protein
MSKIFVMLRTRNEERNIARFCQRYPPENADKILISDGYSTDRTIEIAKTFSNTYFRPFMQIVQGDNGIWRQPEGKHFNFINKWAKEEGAGDEDWVLWDDCDAYPTEAMVKDFRKIFADAEAKGKTCITAFHIYMWGSNEYFPAMNLPGPFIYAWKVKCGMYWDEAESWGVIQRNVPPLESRYNIFEPYALLHDFCPTEEIAQQKYEFYKKSNRMTGIVPILQMGGPHVPLLDWMK